VAEEERGENEVVQLVNLVATLPPTSRPILQPTQLQTPQATSPITQLMLLALNKTPPPM
jgi:hypothetical protein